MLKPYAALAALVVLAALPGPASATELCVQGPISDLSWAGYHLDPGGIERDNRPAVTARIKDKRISIGAKTADERQLTALVEMHSHLLAAMLAGMDVTIWSTKVNACSQPELEWEFSLWVEETAVEVNLSDVRP